MQELTSEIAAESESGKTQKWKILNNLLIQHE